MRELVSYRDDEIEYRRRASSRSPALAICQALLKFLAALERSGTS